MKCADGVEGCSEDPTREKPDTHEESGLSSVAKTGIAVAIGAIVGMFLSTIGTGLQAGQMVASQRQAAAIESIAASMKECAP